MEKTIKYRADRHQQVFQEINRFASKVNEEANKYDELATEIGLPPFSLGLAEGLRGQGTRYLEGDIDRIVATKDRAVQAHYRESHYKDLARVKPLADLLQSFRIEYCPHELQQLTALPWTDNRIKADEAFFEAIRPLFEIRITNGLEAEVWERYTRLAKAYNDFYAFGEQHGLVFPLGQTGLFGRWFTASPPKQVEADPERIFPLRTADYRDSLKH